MVAGADDPWRSRPWYGWQDRCHAAIRRAMDSTVVRCDAVVEVPGEPSWRCGEQATLLRCGGRDALATAEFVLGAACPWHWPVLLARPLAPQVGFTAVREGTAWRVLGTDPLGRDALLAAWTCWREGFTALAQARGVPLTAPPGPWQRIPHTWVASGEANAAFAGLSERCTRYASAALGAGPHASLLGAGFTFTPVEVPQHPQVSAAVPGGPGEGEVFAARGPASSPVEQLTRDVLAHHMSRPDSRCMTVMGSPDGSDRVCREPAWLVALGWRREGELLRTATCPWHLPHTLLTWDRDLHALAHRDARSWRVPSMGRPASLGAAALGEAQELIDAWTAAFDARAAAQGLLPRQLPGSLVPAALAVEAATRPWLAGPWRSLGQLALVHALVSLNPQLSREEASAHVASAGHDALQLMTLALTPVPNSTPRWASGSAEPFPLMPTGRDLASGRWAFDVPVDDPDPRLEELLHIGAARPMGPANELANPG